MRFWILCLCAALIVYGSLYPFTFEFPHPHGAAWARLFHDWSPLTSRGDALGNLALFVPFGIAGMLALAPPHTLAFRIAAVIAISLALSLALQVVQIYTPLRSAALADVFWNLGGAAIGIAATALAPGRADTTPRRILAGGTVPLGLIALWLTAELLPFVPTLDLQAIKDSLRPLLAPRLEPAQMLFHAAGAIIAGRALAVLTAEKQALRWLLVLAGMIVVGKVFIVTRTLDVSTLAGVAAGCAGWWYLARWRAQQRDTAIVMLLLVAYAAGALMPLEFRDVPQSFNLVPFAGLLRGSMLSNSAALAASLCLYAGILAVIRMNGVSPVASSVALAFVVSLFEAMQMYLDGRSPDITEPLLVLLVGQILRYSPLPAPRAKPKVSGAPPPFPRPPSAEAVRKPAAGRFSPARWGTKVAIVCLAIGAALALALRLPGVPYNVAELFRGDGAFPYLVLFALALLWIGAGARLAGHYVARSARPWLVLPLAAFGAAVVSLLLLCASVTQESIGDIAGSNNLRWFVINKGIWGAGAQRLFPYIPSDLVSVLERTVRYSALYAPLITFLGLLFATAEMHRRATIDSRRALLLAVCGGLWLWLCKAIAFDWSSTDNLNELIAPDGPWGWGGGGYLYLLLALICANAVLLARAPITGKWTVAATLVTLALVVPGWWLLNLGLGDQIQKYGSVFSGAQFLLGPDRSHALSPQVLFLRWAVLQLFGVVVIAAGARIAGPLIDWLGQRRASSHAAVLS